MIIYCWYKSLCTFFFHKQIQYYFVGTYLFKYLDILWSQNQQQKKESVKQELEIMIFHSAVSASRYTINKEWIKPDPTQKYMGQSGWGKKKNHLAGLGHVQKILNHNLEWCKTYERIEGRRKKIWVSPLNPLLIGLAKSPVILGTRSAPQVKLFWPIIILRLSNPSREPNTSVNHLSRLREFGFLGLGGPYMKVLERAGPLGWALEKELGHNVPTLREWPGGIGWLVPMLWIVALVGSPGHTQFWVQFLKSICMTSVCPSRTLGVWHWQPKPS